MADEVTPGGERTEAENVEDPLPDTELPANRRQTNRWVGLTLMCLGVFVLLASCWVGWRTYQAYRHLTAAAADVTSLQTQIKNLGSIDLAAASDTVSNLQTQSRAAVDATSDPVVRLARHLPWIGPNLYAIGEISGTVDDLAKGTAANLIQVARTLNPAALAPSNGSIDLTPIIAASGPLQRAAQAVSDAQARIARVPREDLLRPVSKAAGDLQAKLTSLSSTTTAAARLGRLLPPMLGSQSRRSYLVVFQNLAEPRATGGIFGSYALVEVTHGTISIEDTGASSRVLGEFVPPVRGTVGQLPSALYGDLPQRYATDVNLTPDFPTAAKLFMQMYQARKGVTIDGVLAIDPVALSYLLPADTSIALGHGIDLTPTNATSILLSRVYQLFPDPSDEDARDAFLDNALVRTFTAVTTSHSDPSRAVHGLISAAAEHRLMIYSAAPAEQQDLAATPLVGSLPTSDGTKPVVGVFRNDGTGGKLGYYATGSASLKAGTCHAGRRALSLTVDLGYAGPTAGLPPYVLGRTNAGPYVLRTNVMLFSPVDGDLSSIELDGRAVAVAWDVQAGRKVGMVTVDLEPGEHAVLTGTFTAPANAAAGTTYQPELQLTPGITNWATEIQAYRSCTP